MRAFKKRTIALVLASVVTVVGAFGAENYKNSLMGLGFNQGPDGLNLVLQTRLEYEPEITPLRKDENTYVVMLPEVNSRAITPNLNKVAGNISSVDIQTLPYSNGSKGYTRIVIKTAPSIVLGVEKQVFVPGERYKYLENNSSHSDDSASHTVRRTSNSESHHSGVSTASATTSSYSSVPSDQELAKKRAMELKKRQAAQEAAELAKKKSALEKAKQQALEIQKANEAAQKVVVQPDPQVDEKNVEPEVSADYYNDNNQLVYILGGILLLAIIAYFIVKAKNKLHELTGEQIVIDVSDDDETEKQKKAKESKKDKKAKVEAKKIDKNVKKSTTVVQPVVAELSYSSNNEEVAPIETVNVVDLDEIFKEQSKTQMSEDIDEDENAALEDFLSGFSFDEELIEEEYTPGYDVEFYEKIINNPACKFTKEDVEKINKLLNMEINDSTLKNIEKYAVSNPIKKSPSRKQILEEFVTTYAISQNVTFTKDDVGALYKLISVEIDSDFITDLKTNPERVKEMEEEISNRANRPKKATELLTLNVKDVLPDLSEALRQQGGRAIQFEAKPQTVYFSEGYDVSKLSLDSNALPDLSVEINNEKAYVSKPSYEYDLVDNSYDVSRLKISSQLPDLMDMLQNPDKYKKEEVRVEVSEEDLLNNIANVQFKPFDAGQEFEVLNNVEDFDGKTIIDIEKELSQFDNLEIVNDDERDFDDSNLHEVDSLYENEYLDFDKNKTDISEKFEEESDANDESLLEQITLDSEKVEESSKENLVPEVESNIVEDLILDELVSEENTKQLENTSQIEEEESVVPAPENTIEINEVEEQDNPVVEINENVLVEEPKEELLPEKQEFVIQEESINVEPVMDGSSLQKESLQKTFSSNALLEEKKALSKERSNDLLKRIEDVKSRRVERNERINSIPRQVSSTSKASNSSKVIADIKCIFEGQTYTVISTAHFIGRAGCYLAKNENGYMVLGHYGDKLFNLRQYEVLKSEKIQTRLSEKISADTYRYLVRIGINKFVVDVTGDNISYVMDLC